jgi:hypothetical protein
MGRDGTCHVRFVVYRGDEVLGVGTAAELAERLKVKPDTIRFYASPACHRRDRHNNRTVAYRI